MEISVALRQQTTKERLRMATGVNDYECLIAGGDFASQCSIVHWAAFDHLDTLQILVKLRRVGNNFADTLQANVEVVRAMNSGLSGGAKQHRCVVASGEFPKQIETWAEILDRKTLRFIKDDD